MTKLLKCEFKKFKSTYINSLSFLGMLIPVLLVTVMFVMRKNDWIKAGSYNWKNFNSQLTMFFVFLVGPIITSFIAVFSVFYEYQSKTMKNVISSPHGRISILSAKMIYVAAFVILQYIAVAAVNIICACLLGFQVNLNDIVIYSRQLILAGITTAALIPIMMFLTLVFKNFIAGMVITVGGTISNVLVLNWEKSYISPWAAPADIVASVGGNLPMNIIYPIISICAYLILFTGASMIYFKIADQST